MNECENRRRSPDREKERGKTEEKLFSSQRESMLTVNIDFSSAVAVVVSGAVIFH